MKKTQSKIRYQVNSPNLSSKFQKVSQIQQKNKGNPVQQVNRKTKCRKTIKGSPFTVINLDLWSKQVLFHCIQYSIVSYGLKCDCFIIETNSKKNSKTGKVQNMQIKPNQIKKKVKLQITINKQNLSIIKSGVQHIFLLPIDTKHDFLKVILSENWQLQQFHITNKKTKIVDGQMLSTSQNKFDQIYPLKNIIECDQLRKKKLLKSDSKLKIAWGCTQKDSDFHNESEKLSFTVTKKINETSKSLLLESNKQIQRIAFLRKSLNQCDQTRDSQEEAQIQQNIQLQELTLNSNRPKALSINFDLWSHTSRNQSFSMSQLKLKKQESSGHSFNEKRSNISVTQRHFK